jgi:hypothetical protein
MLVIEQSLPLNDFDQGQFEGCASIRRRVCFLAEIGAFKTD